MTTTTTTASVEMMVPSSNYIHCVASDSIPASPPSFLPSTSSVRKEPSSPTIRNYMSPEHTSFDLTPVSPPWYVERPLDKSRLRNWLRRQYYQYEVTCGLYVLTPTEKLIINTLVLSFFSLIGYGFTKIVVRRYVAVVVWKTGVIILCIILRELGELLLDSGSSSISSDGDIISRVKNIEQTAMPHSH